MLWFTSDHHFGHANIIKHDGRPFACVDEMNEQLIRRWNECVRPHEEVWHLGDLVFRAHGNPAEIIRRLHGRIHIVWGNHDGDYAQACPELFASTHDLVRIRHAGQTLVLCHYPLEEWHGSHRGTWHLHGHCHGSRPPRGMRLDVGVNRHDYRPWSFDEVAAYMATRTPEPHHGRAGDE
jgi:calcineurin-like phosphoesterase family protein